MIPICRDAGSVIAFGGRATEADQQPKYLNSPETPIYSKSRTLYGLNYSKAAIRKLNYAVLVEGYFDFAQLVQAGISPVVASCGTALTPQQAQLLRRFTSKVVLSFDPDAAGQGAAVRSCELLVAEGFDVNVALLPAGADPDTFVQRQGRDAYQDRLRGVGAVSALPARPGRRRARPRHGRRPPDVSSRDAGGGGPHPGRRRPGPVRGPAGAQSAHYGRGGSRRDPQGRRGAQDQRPRPRDWPPPGRSSRPNGVCFGGSCTTRRRSGRCSKSWKTRIWNNLRSAQVFEAARELHDVADWSFPSALLERLNDRLSQQVTAVAAEPAAPANAPA